MKFSPPSCLAVIGMLTPMTTMADDVEERLARMEARMAEMQRRLDTQDQRIRSQETLIQRQAATIAQHDATMSPNAGSPPGNEQTAWTDRVEVTGVVEFEATHSSAYDGTDESDFSVATAELGIAAQVSEWVAAGVSLLYEQDDTDLEVDVAYLALANPQASPWFLTAGQVYVPFGTYDTSLVSDPLTLELGETRETALQAGWARGPVAASLYAFNGDNEKDGENTIASWGAQATLVSELAQGVVALNLGYTSDLGDADTLQGVIVDNLGSHDTDRVAAWTAGVTAELGPFVLIGEYLAAAESFEAAAVGWNGSGARPSAWNLEAGYNFSLLNKAATVAVGYQGSGEAIALELPRRRLLAALSVGIFDNTALSLEWSHDTDYDSADGGTGEDANALVAQLAVEF